jgi:hypothetical protein
MPTPTVHRIVGTLETLTPLLHFGTEKTGSTPAQRMMTLWDREQGTTVEVPFVNANAVRGVLRRLVMADFLDLVGYTVETPKLHHALYTGGQLESTDDNTSTIDVAMRRTLIEHIPPLGLLGTSVGNQILSGCLCVEHALPCCQERRWVRTVRDARRWDDDPRWDEPGSTYIGEHFQTRRDDLRADREEDEQAVQMLVKYECITPGALLEHGYVLRNASPVETACLGRALELWCLYPTIGGKASGGMGQLAVSYDHVPDSGPYIDWCTQHADEAIDALNLIANPPKAKTKKGKEAAE